MGFKISADRLRVILNQFRDRLWVKPLMVCLVSIVLVFAAKLADGTQLTHIVPVIALDSIETLLSIMASSMLVIATFSVGSMVSAYASASRTATPRSFTLVVSDGASQNALSTFIGSFIFSIVALTAVKNEIFQSASLFILFVLTAFVFGLVVFTFVRWVDRIARLGRMGSTIGKVERATAEAIKRRRDNPTLCGASLRSQARGQAVYASTIGYVQHIHMEVLQTWAEKHEARIVIAALPGTFTAPGRPLAFVSTLINDVDYSEVVASFQIGCDRLFDDDPRFGLVVLSEIAGRALSPAVNDPGTAIDVIGVLVRLFALWSETGNRTELDNPAPRFDRIEVPEVSVRDMFDDAFSTIARDGAGMVEVGVRLQKALCALALIKDGDIAQAAELHQQLALKRAQCALTIEEDLIAVRDAAKYLR